MANNDILLDENEDLMIVNGDLVLGPSDQQHIRHILLGDKGSFKDVRVGMGTIKYVKSTGSEIKFKKDLKAALDQDGYKLNSVDLNATGGLKIDAEAK